MEPPYQMRIPALLNREERDDDNAHGARRLRELVRCGGAWKSAPVKIVTEGGRREREKKWQAHGTTRSPRSFVSLSSRNSSLVVYRLIKRARSNTERATTTGTEKKSGGGQPES